MGAVKVSTKFGNKNLVGQIRKMQIKLGTDAENFTTDILNEINKRAMEYLDSLVRWGHSEDQNQRIKNTFVIEDYEGDVTYWRHRAKYTSPHAWIVEHGGYGMIHMKNTPMPVGKQQGMIGAGFASKVSMQEGYHYLRHAMDIMDQSTIKRLFMKYYRRV